MRAVKDVEVDLPFDRIIARRDDDHKITLQFVHKGEVVWLVAGELMPGAVLDVAGLQGVIPMRISRA